MAKNKFTDFLNRIFYEEGGSLTAETTESTQEGMEALDAPVPEVNDENVTQMAQRIIADSQIESDNDEFPDISNVQSVLDTAGIDADHELIRKILTNFAHCDPEALEKDGITRKQAILNAIEQVKQQAADLKSEKLKDEEALSQAEKDAEAACTEAISQANIESEKAIEEEKARSAAIIAEIRQKTEAATEAAKQERTTTLESISAQRAENETTLQRSANLVAETERQGQIIIKQIDTWLAYLK